MRRVFLLVGPVVLLPLCCISQPGVSEMNQARGFLEGSFFSMRDLSIILAALIAIVGSLQVYNKWQSGKDVSTDLPAWFFASLFVLLSGSFLTALFGI